MNQHECEIFQEFDDWIDKLQCKLRNEIESFEQSLIQWMELRKQQATHAEEVIDGHPPYSASVGMWENWLGNLKKLQKEGKDVGSLIGFAVRMICLKKLMDAMNQIIAEEEWRKQFVKDEETKPEMDDDCDHASP